jgi:hypothetical protein
MRKIYILAFFAFFSYNISFAQTQNQNSVWFMGLNSTKFNDKWGLHFDFQLRSADKVDYLRNVLIRPGITYYINSKQNATLGYLLTTTHTELPDNADYTLTEHRIWQQYILSHKIKSVFASHRVRLEQRFIEQLNGEDIFSQRFRYFFRFIQPLQKVNDSFNKGPFVALQNEVFLNIHHKNLLNNHGFDQNRAYLAAGYRFSNQIDLEAGYMNQSVNGRQNNISNQILQFAFYVRL